jgi:hypothetical protein
LNWKCPKCHRVFKTKNQSHSCVIVSPDDLFDGTSNGTNALYEKLKKKCRRFSDFTTDTTRSCIYFVDQERYLVVKPQKNGLILEFVLHEKLEMFPVTKTYDIGKGRFVHRIKLDEPGDLTKQVMDWIREAHQILAQS